MIKDVNKLHVKTQWAIECPNCDGQGSTSDDFFGYINCAHCDGEGWLFGDSREGVVGLAEDVIEFL